MYGSKSEKTPTLDEKQLGLFNEAEQEYIPEPVQRDNRGYHIRTKEERWKLVGGKDIKFEDRILALQGKDLFCTHCGVEMTCIGKDGLQPVVLFEYQPGRSGEYPKKFLEGFTWYLHTDGYAGYNKVEGITRCGCWTHLRRKFVDAMPPALADLVGPPSSAQVGRDYCDQLFAAEKKIELLSAKDRQRVRLEVETLMLRAFWC